MDDKKKKKKNRKGKKTQETTDDSTNTPQPSTSQVSQKKEENAHLDIPMENNPYLKETNMEEKKKNRKGKKTQETTDDLTNTPQPSTSKANVGGKKKLLTRTNKVRTSDIETDVITKEEVKEDPRPYNVMEDEQEVMRYLLRTTFHRTESGAIDLSKPLDTNFSEEKVAWPPAEPLKEMDLVVKVTYVGDSCDICFHEVPNEYLEVINDEVKQVCEGTQPLEHPYYWEARDICLGRYFVDNTWYRAVVLQANSDYTYLVKFVDYGTEDNLSHEELRLAFGTTLRPIQSHVGYFDNLFPINGTWETSVIEKIHRMLVDRSFFISLRPIRHVYGITSMLDDEGRDVLQEIISRGFGEYRTLSSKSPEVAEPQPSTSGTSRRRPSKSAAASSEEGAVALLPSAASSVQGTAALPGDGAHSCSVNWLVFFELRDKYELSSSGYELINVPAEVEELTVEIVTIPRADLLMMYVVATDNDYLNQVIASYNDLELVLQEEAELMPNLVPPYLFKQCVSKYEDMWYRAIVVDDTSSIDGSVQVQYVDYGNVERVDANELKQLKEGWLSVPVQLIPCRLHGYKFNPDVPEDEAIECLRQIFVEKPSIKAVIRDREKNIGVELFSEYWDLLYEPLIAMTYLIKEDM